MRSPRWLKGATLRFVLVPSPFTGPLAWAFVRDALVSQGHAVMVADLRVEPVADTASWVAHVDEIARAVGDVSRSDPVVLVAHSGAGPLLPAANARLGDVVGASVFVDAGLPHPGQSRVDALPAPLAEQLRGMVRNGRLPRWSEWFGPGAIEHLLPDRSVRAEFVAELPEVAGQVMAEQMPDVPTPQRPCAYLQLSAAYAEECQRARDLGWPVRVHDSTHLGVITEPDAVARDLVDLALELGVRPG